MDALQQIVPVLFLILASIYLVGAVMGVIFFVGAERQRSAMLALRDVELDSALADLRMRREAAEKDYGYDSPEVIRAAIGQIILDVTGEQHGIADVKLEMGRTLAFIVLGLDGNEFALTPSAESFLAEYNDKREKAKDIFPVNGLVSTLFVVQELGAMAKFFNPAALLPRTEQWHLISLAATRRVAVRTGRRGFGLFRRFRWSRA